MNDFREYDPVRRNDRSARDSDGRFKIRDRSSGRYRSPMNWRRIDDDRLPTICMYPGKSREY